MLKYKRYVYKSTWFYYIFPMASCFRMKPASYLFIISIAPLSVVNGARPQILKESFTRTRYQCDFTNVCTVIQC